MPDSSFCYVARTLFDFVGKEIMALLGEEKIPAFNMFAIFRLHRDVTTLANFAETCYPPGLVVRLPSSMTSVHVSSFPLEESCGALLPGYIFSGFPFRGWIPWCCCLCSGYVCSR